MSYRRIECTDLSQAENIISVMQETFQHVEFVALCGGILTIAFL